jgi:hypothetical protein
VYIYAYMVAHETLLAKLQRTCEEPFYSLGLLTMRTGHLQFCAQWLLTLPKNALQQCSFETKVNE